MVVIELDETDKRDSDLSNPSSSHETTPSNGIRNADDGFETASDGDLADSDGEDEERLPETRHHPPQESEEPPKHLGEKEEEEEEEQKIISDHELQEKALAQANEAKLEGNKLYGNGQLEEALSKYELALYFAPDVPSSTEIRSTCHSNRAICYLKLGKYEDTIKECTKALELNPSYVKALLRRAEAHEKLEHFEEGIVDMKKILELDPTNEQARKSIRRMEPLAEQKREKMKEEMLGKLKEMGNSVLGRFGMSVDNFKAVKDPNTGSYSISFQR